MRISTLCPALLLAGSTLAARAAAIPATAQESRESAQEVAAALQKKYNSVRDFTADFVHDSEGGVLRKKQSESGTVQVKKPGKMRWDYKTPEPKLFVSDGRRIYLHVPADNQVIISPVPDEDQATTRRLFLVGKGNLTRDFTVTFVPGGRRRHLWRCACSPLPERDYDWLQVVVDRRTLQIRSLSAAESQGGRSTFQFSNFKENVGLSDKVRSSSRSRVEPM